jgi:group I intron endonuclease
VGLNSVLRQFCVSGIYAIKNRVTGAVYVGQSRHVIHRLSCHVQFLVRGAHSLKPLQADFYEYGWDHFDFVLVEACPESALIAREDYWIRKFHSEGVKLYNADPGLPVELRSRKVKYAKGRKRA